MTDDILLERPRSRTGYVMDDVKPAQSFAPADTAAADMVSTASVKLKTNRLNFYYKETHALKNINMEMRERRVTAIIGPSGCGKSTLLRVFNRIYSVYPGLKAQGEVLLDGENILD